MTHLLSIAKKQLAEQNYTCVLWNGETAHTTTKRGIQPLWEWLHEEKNLSTFVAADRVVGKAAAFLYVLLGVRAVYADVVSRPAEQVLRRYGIPLEYGTVVDAIQNRTHDGFCPMEQAVWEIDAPQEALVAVAEARKRLNIQ